MSFIDRIKIEQAEVNARLTALNTFLTKDKPEIVSEYQWDLLIAQRYAMSAYVKILDMRLEDLK